MDNAALLLLIMVIAAFLIAFFVVLPRLTGTNTGEASVRPNIDTAVGTGQTRGQTISERADALPGQKTANHAPGYNTTSYEAEQPDYFEKQEDES